MKTVPKKRNRISRRDFLAVTATPLLADTPASSPLAGKRVFVVPNFHPASCGWLTNWSKERVYCANSYFDHLDRVRDDPNYAFVLSEVNNIIAMMNFKPERTEELRKRIKEGRVELVNGFFLESTINLSGGEALVRLGVEGLRWQQQVFGVRPRFAWTIDVCGTHDQMAQISAGLGLEAMVYTRKNPTGSSVHWSESPDGTRILTFCPGGYSQLGQLMNSVEPLAPAKVAEIEKYLEGRLKTTPERAPILILAGGGDYSLAPKYKQYPREFLEMWKQSPSHPEMRFTSLSKYLDAVQPGIRSGVISIPTMRGGTAYDFDSFWIECPRVKSWYRKDEHALQAAEALATAASLLRGYAYPSQELYNAWTLMFLCMDRNTLWGSAGGMVFEHEKSWDVKDRFEWVENHSAAVLNAAGSSLLAPGDGTGLFNPLSWKRNDPVVLPLSESIEGALCQDSGGGAILCEMELPAASAGAWKRSTESPAAARKIALPDRIRTKYYDVAIDPKTGAITSLKLRSSGREILATPANVMVAEKPRLQKGDPGDFMVPRPERDRLDTTDVHEHTVGVTQGPLATIVDIQGTFIGGGVCRRVIRFYNDFPRIDFETELNDIPDRTVVVAEFPLAEEIVEVRRGIPYGFSHGAWAKPNPDLHGWTKGIVPAVRWSHYTLENGGGVAILDRGVTGRELNGKTPVIYLYNATDKYYGYPNSWLSGKGKHVLEYALVVHDGDWKQARIPQMAWEYNCPPTVVPHRAVAAPKSFLTASDNIIVEAVRRLGTDIEVRLAECLGVAGRAEIALSLPHTRAALTDLVGGKRKPISGAGGRYQFRVRAQQIVTLRFRAASSVNEAQLVMAWDDMVPRAKLTALHEYSNEKGHPPRGD
jgi:alpha-mannosidase